MLNQLLQLQEKSIIVADTGDIQSIIEYKPQDATTNPSLILKAAQLEIYKPLVADAIAWAKQKTNNNVKNSNAVDNQLWQLASERLGILIGAEITKLVPGEVSTEVDARLSFDTAATIQKAQDIIDAYENLGVAHSKILIKIAATWQGIQAARELEQQGIHCNLTLLFSLAQARACAAAGVYLISPFVGRISDWYKAQGEIFSAENDPGVLSVKNIYYFYKKNKVETAVMAASFRNKEQILQLAGCDRLTVAPDLLEALRNSKTEIETHISTTLTDEQECTVAISQQEFLWQMHTNVMAHEKLADGIRRFAADSIKLEEYLQTC